MNTEPHKFKRGDRVRWKGSEHCQPREGWCIGRGEYDMALVRLDGQRVARRFYDEQLEYLTAKSFHEQLRGIRIAAGRTA